MSLSQYTHGDQLALDFQGSSDQTPSSGTQRWESMDLTSWTKNYGSVSLCEFADPDNPCADERFVWQRKG